MEDALRKKVSSTKPWWILDTDGVNNFPNSLKSKWREYFSKLSLLQITEMIFQAPFNPYGKPNLKTRSIATANNLYFDTQEMQDCPFTKQTIHGRP